MKERLRKVTSAILAMTMVTTPLFSAMPVLAASNESNDGITVESSVLDSSKSDEDITISDVTEESAIEVEKAEDKLAIDISESDDMSVSEKQGVSVKFEETKPVTAGENMDVKFHMSNTGTNKSNIRLYLYDLSGDLPEKKDMWAEKLTDVCTDIDFVDLKDNVIKTGDVTWTYQEDKQEDEIKSRYLEAEVPAGFDSDVSLKLHSQFADEAVFVISDGAYIAAKSIVWGVEKIVIEDTTDVLDEIVVDVKDSKNGEVLEESNTVTEGTGSDIILDEIPVMDIEFGQSNVSTNGLKENDFSSKRLVVLADDSQIVNQKDVIGSYGDVHLMQFESVEDTQKMYAFYQGQGISVEPDYSLQIASNSEIELENVSMDEKNNPLKMLSNEDATEMKDENIIALIDTGVRTTDNVVGRISVIDDVLDDNGSMHGNDMLDNIVSQNPNAKVLSIRALNDKGIGTVSSLVAAMEYAMEQDVDMINLSLYARKTLETSVLLDEIQKAVDKGILVVGAAGNDGNDVKDYVPGSLSDAWIIGSANADGKKLRLSNYGGTVDYYVKSESTSDAASLFTGYVSANGLDSVKNVLNQGLIYEPEFAGNEKPEEHVDAEDFSKYKLDKDKSAYIKYTFVRADKMDGTETIESIFHGNLDTYFDKVVGTFNAYADVYHTKNGEYKFKANAPILNGYMVSDAYQDAVFADGNDNGEAIDKGMSIDKKTGIVTVESAVMEEKLDENDFANVQVQVLVPVDENNMVNQTIRIENKDGSSYEKNISLKPFVNQKIPLGFSGKDKNLTSDDFEVYVNNMDKPVDIEWLEDENAVVLKSVSGLIFNVDIKVKSDVSVNFTAASYRNYAPAFYLPDGTDVRKLGVGTKDTVTVRQFHSAFGNPVPGDYIGSVHSIMPGNSVGGNGVHMGGFGIPTNLFDLPGGFISTSDGVHAYPRIDGDGVSTNTPIAGFCNHIGSPYGWATTKKMNFQILDRWEENGVTYFAVSAITTTGITNADNGATQATGGVFNFAVKGPRKGGLSVQKQSGDNSITNGNGNYSLQGAEYGIYKDGVLKKTIVTNASGYAATGDDELDAGTYTVKETKPSKGYNLDPTTYTVNVVAGKTANQNVTHSSEPPKTAIAELNKQSANPSMTDDNNCYSLAGAVYRVYRDANLSSVYATMTTDKNGYAKLENLPFGEYWIQEYTASPGYYLEGWPNATPPVHHLNLTESNAKQSFTSVEPPMDDPGGIELTKLWDGPETETIPPLTGTEFTVKYYDGYYTETQLPSTPKRTWRFEMKKNGDKYIIGFTDDYLKAGSDPLYKDAYGIPVLPLGTITIQETKAAPGYTLDGYLTDEKGNKVPTNKLYVNQIRNANDGVKLQGGNKFSAENTPKKGQILLKKFKEDGTSPLEGVTFHCEGKTTGYSKDFVTGKDGIVKFTDLYPDVYTITEIDTGNGYQLLKEPLVVRVPTSLSEEQMQQYHIDKSKATWDEWQKVWYIHNFTYEITNHANFTPPMTGGMFSAKMLIPLGLGVVLVGGLAVMIFRKKKRS